jgi:hypothetical protein
MSHLAVPGQRDAVVATEDASIVRATFVKAFLEDMTTTSSQQPSSPPFPSATAVQAPGQWAVGSACRSLPTARLEKLGPVLSLHLVAWSLETARGWPHENTLVACLIG